MGIALLWRNLNLVLEGWHFVLEKEIVPYKPDILKNLLYVKVQI